jgi:hypothetical protein
MGERPRPIDYASPQEPEPRKERSDGEILLIIALAFFVAMLIVSIILVTRPM